MKNNATNSPVPDTCIRGGYRGDLCGADDMVFLPISFGPIQFRISELLCVLPYFTPAAIPGLFIGCLLANFLCGAAALDVIFGSIATLIGAVGSYLLRKNRYLVSVPPIPREHDHCSVGAPFACSEDMIWFSTITVGIGEILAIGLLGQILLSVLIRYQQCDFWKSCAKISDPVSIDEKSSRWRDFYGTGNFENSLFHKKGTNVPKMPLARRCRLSQSDRARGCEKHSL